MITGLSWLRQFTCLGEGKLRSVHSYLQIRANRHFLSAMELPDKPATPIFIIGPPRCGSTLLYQAMVHCFDLCFFTNEMMRRPAQVPMNIHYRRLGLAPGSSFQSNYGQTDGDRSPHEGYPFWRRFYPRNEHDYVERHCLSDAEVEEMRSTVKFMEHHYGSPFLSKNIENALRIKSLSVVYPEALYIVLKRDPRAIAISILSGRMKLREDKKDWFGMRPINYSNLVDLPIANQIAEQILQAYDSFYSDVETDRVFELYYEDFCKSPEALIEQIGSYLNGRKIRVKKTGGLLPRSFPLGDSSDLDSDALEDFTKALKSNPALGRNLQFRSNERQDE